MRRFLSLLLLFPFLTGCDKDDGKQGLRIEYISVGSTSLKLDGTENTVLGSRDVVIQFSSALNPGPIISATHLFSNATSVPFTGSVTGAVVRLTLNGFMQKNTSYTLQIDPGPFGANGEPFEGYTITFTTLAGELNLESCFI